MSKLDVEADFPLLVQKPYDLSEEDFNYNCLAYALGDYSHWWEPPKKPGQYWPPGFAEDITVRTVESIIQRHGFTVTLPTNALPATEAIAIYASGDEWNHFAKFSNGSWSSKLGDGHDIVGVDLGDLEGRLYGKVVKILARPGKVDL